MSAAAERVYALHDFDAENPDEVSFKAGEAVIVVEKDDAYGDGWWQGTNLKGETGLFPFSYTTYDREAAKTSAAAQRSSDDTGPGNGPNGKVMNTTMADIDEALAGLRTGNGSGTGGKGVVADRRSMNSERTGDFSVGDTDENGADAEDDLEARAKARAALAVNAARNQEEMDEAERAEQVRMKAQAQRIFEEEEEKQRQLLLKKEEERKIAAAQGTLKEPDRAKVAPIAGLDMSDDSDSEGSEGPDYDDGMAAPTHAPLFGALGNSAQSSKTSGTPQPYSGMTTASGNTSRDANLSSFERQQQQSMGQGRNLSPIASSVGGESPGPRGNDQTALYAGATAAAASGLAAGTYAATSRSSVPHQRATSSNTSGPPATDSATSFDQKSVSSSKGRGSAVADSPAAGSSAAFVPGAFNGSSATGTAPTSMMGTETPKSQFTAAAQQSPSPSVAHSRQQHHTAPGGDPRDWTVDQVVEWGRSKGWDEAQVVSKFAEHEISGDVLLEMDINILKEIDIQAFGKRFQVSSAIKELNKAIQSGAANPAMEQRSATPDVAIPAVVSPAPFPPQQHPMQQMQQIPPQQPIQRSFSPPIQSPNVQGQQQFNVPGRASSNSIPTGIPAHPQMAPQSATAPYFDIVQPSSEADAAGVNSTGWTQSPMMAGGGGGGGGGRSSQERNTARYSGDVGNNGPGADGRRASLRTGSDEPPVLHSSTLVGTPGVGARKRESAGSASGKNSTDRSSFFAGFSSTKGRKPAPRVLSQTPTEVGDSKGTFSRLGFNRSKQGGNEAGTPVSDLRNKISLPTSSPTYDAFGDTARRNRVSQLSSGSGGMLNNGAGANRSATGAYGGHQKQASMGSAGPNAADWHTPQSPTNDQRTPGGGTVEGPVMLRIRPVDREGWMRKKGERYNSWKPRYLALKGSDLVLLREPSAAKIKGYVSMKGYKVIADENTNPGKYGFKILHETEKPHYFSSDDAIVVREWMKALMKATIDRDTSLPVISSYNNATISLKEAQRMNPPPRPPSPTSRARAQRATARANKDQLTAKDASVLMGLHQSGDVRQKGFLIRDSSQSSFDIVQQPSRRQQEEARVEIHPDLPYQALGPSPWARPTAKSIPCNIGRPDLRAAFIKRIVPLHTSNLRQKDGNSLPILVGNEDEEESNISTNADVLVNDGWDPAPITPGPPPLPKSTTSTTFGCADLPAPPPPSHSPDHGRKIRAFMHRLGKSKRSHVEKRIEDAPTPLSKSGSEGSISTYPTLSAKSEMMSSAPTISTFLNQSEAPRERNSRWYHNDMIRPKSAGAGSNRSPCSSRNFSKLHASTVEGSRESFIVFSVRKENSNVKGAMTSPRRPSTADASTRDFEQKDISEAPFSPLTHSTINRGAAISSLLRNVIASPQDTASLMGEEMNSGPSFYRNQIASESSPDIRKLRRFLPTRKRSHRNEAEEETRIKEAEDEMEADEGSQNRHWFSNVGKVSTVEEEIGDSNNQAYEGIIRQMDEYGQSSPALPPIPFSPAPPTAPSKV